MDQTHERAAEYVVSSEFTDSIVHGRVPWPITCIVQALKETAAEQASEGWTPVDAAVRWINEKYPDERPDGYGCTSWRQVIHETQMFDLRYFQYGGSRRGCGYRVRRELRPDGTVTTGDRDIQPAEAAVVLRIFSDYAAGLSARAIAAALNAEGTPGPNSGKGDGTWGPSTISGNWKRGTGILSNELYIDRLIWDRQTFVTDPQTQKHQARMNPPEQWITEDIPDLRIVDDALWHSVKTRQGAIRTDMKPAGHGSGRIRPEAARRPSYLLSGLVRCGCCGASYTLIN